MKNGQQWERVTGANLNTDNVLRAVKNIKTLASTSFKRACDNVGIEPTKRQASKWNNRKGLAYKTWNNIVEVMKYYDTLIDENPNITINVHSVIQIYNVNVINELNDFIKLNFPRFKSDIQMLQYPEFLSIKNLPKEYKDLIKHTITDDKILNYLNIEADNLFEHFYNYDKSLNEIRRESLKDTNPVLSEYINNYAATSDSKDYLIQHIRFIKSL